MGKSTTSLAQLSDVDEMTDLLYILFTQESDFNPSREKQMVGLKTIIENKEIGQILTLKLTDKIIGMVTLLYTISTALGGRVAILEDMILDQAHRGRGEGATLLKSAIELARQENCRRITLLTDLTNENAIKFYQRQGFVKSAMTPLRLIL